MAPSPLPYEKAEAWCHEHHGPSAVVAGYTGYPKEELALMRLCAPEEKPADPVSTPPDCWVFSPLHNGKRECLVQRPAPFDPKILIGDMGRLEIAECNSSHRFLCAIESKFIPQADAFKAELEMCRNAPPIKGRLGESSPEAVGVDNRHAPLVLVAEATPIRNKTSPRRASLVLTWFIAATNDEYGGYRAAMRSSSAIAAVVHGR